MKKWLAAMLAAILVLNIALPANVLAEVEAAQPVEVTKYVSEGGDDANEGTEAAPYATIKKAEPSWVVQPYFKTSP